MQREEIILFYFLRPPCGESHVVYMSMWCFLKCFKTNNAQIHKSTPLLSIFSLKLQWTKDSLKNQFRNRWCFWRHKLPCNQSVFPIHLIICVGPPQKQHWPPQIDFSASHSLIIHWRPN